MAGLLPLVLSPLDDSGTHERLLEASGGLLLTGGEDVDPARYGEDATGARRVSPLRDEMEFGLLRVALERDLPVLAICRGMQVLNVALGGSLHQDLATEFDTSVVHDRSRDSVAPAHDVRPDRPGLLEGVLPAGPTTRNSAHHQGVDRLAPDLTPVGHAPDGLVEAVEYRRPGGGWTVGVQWHAEREIARSDGVNRRLFQAFGDAVRGVPPSREDGDEDPDGVSGPRLVP